MNLKGKTFRKRFLSFAAGAVMALNVMLPNGLRLATAAGGYPVKVSYFQKDGSPSAGGLQDAAAGQTYYALASLSSGDTLAKGGTLVGWQYLPLETDKAEVNLEFDDFYKSDDDKKKTETKIDNWSDYHANFRIYRWTSGESISADNAYAQLTDALQAYAIGEVPGYIFTGTSITDTGADVKLTRADITYTINIDYGGVSVAPADNIYLFVTAKHQSGDAYYLQKLTSDDTEIKIQTADGDIWMDENGNTKSNPLGGSETITIRVLKSTNSDLNMNNARSLTNCSVLSEGSFVKNGKLSFGASVRGVADLSDTITLTPVAATNDYNLRSILGDAVNFGIVADRWDKENHAQTNFAVNYYDSVADSSTDQDLNGDSGGEVYVAYFCPFEGNTPGAVTTGNSLYVADKIVGTDPVMVYMDHDNYGYDLRNDANVLAHAQLVQMDADKIAEHNNKMLDNMKAVSDELAAKPANAGMTADGVKLYLDTTCYPFDATIYVDADPYVEDNKYFASTGALNIKKREGQTIVFNFKTATDVKIDRFECTVEKKNGEIVTSPSNDGSFSPMTKGEQNSFLDDYVTRYIVWNLNKATNIQVGTTTGVFLIPKADSVCEAYATSSGWMITAGLFRNTGSAEWHNFYQQLGEKIGSKYLIDLYKTDTAGNDLARAKLAAEKFNGTTFEPYDIAVTSGSNPDQLQLEPGKYKIYELEAPEGYIETDTAYYISVEETGKYYYYNDGTVSKTKLDEKGTMPYYESVSEVTVKRYESDAFNPAVETATYSTLSVNTNTYQDEYGDLYTFEVDAAGTIKSVTKNGTPVTDAAELAKFKAVDAKAISGEPTLCYNGAAISASGGVYTVDGKQYTIKLNPEKDQIEEIAVANAKQHFTLWNDFGNGGALTLSYYADSSKLGGSPSDENAVVTTEGPKKYAMTTTFGKVEVEGEANNVQNVKLAKDGEAFAKFTISNLNFVVTADGKLLYPVLNITANFEQRLAFQNGRAFDFKKLNAETNELLPGATLKLIEETYTVAMGTYALTYKAPDADCAKFVWDSAAAAVKMTEADFTKFWGGWGDMTVYRLTETAAPADFETSETDIIILKYSWFGNTTWYKAEVPAGKHLDEIEPAMITGGGMGMVQFPGFTKLDITDDAQRVFALKDKPVKKNTVTIDKQALDADAHPASASATFDLIPKDGQSLVGVTVAGTVLTAADLNTDGSYTFTGSSTEITDLPDGNYTLKETVAPDGHTVVSEFPFEMSGGAVVPGTPTTTGGTVTLESGKITVTDDISVININKQDMSGGAIPATNPATFTLTLETPVHAGTTLEGVKYTDAGASKTAGAGETSITFAGNDTNLIGLPDGTYTLEEVTAPTDYEKIGAVSGESVVSKFTFTVKDGKVDTSSTIATTTGKVVLEGDKIIVQDAPETKPIVISKKTVDANAVEASAPATFTLTAETGKNLDGVKFGDTTLTASDTSVTFTGADTAFSNLPDGKYTLTEVTAPDGYTVVSTFTFEVVDGKVDTSKTVSTTTGKVDLKDDQVIITDDISRIKLSKSTLDASGSEAPADATFVLKADHLEDAASLAAAGVMVQFGTGTPTALGSAEGCTFDAAQSTFEFTGKDVSFIGLPDGDYTLTETVAPDGFTVVSSFPFTVENGVVKPGTPTTTGGTVTLASGEIAVTDNISDITLKKADFTTKEVIDAANPATFTLTLDTPAEGVTRTLKDAKITSNSTEADAVKISDDGKTATIKGNIDSIKGLPDGKYTLVESTSPDGYKTVDTVFTFTVENGAVKPESTTTNGDHFVLDDGNIVILDDVKNTVTISKKIIDQNSATSKAPATFELTVTSEGKTLTGVTYTEDGTEKTAAADSKTITFTAADTVFSGLPDGTYTLKETTAPDGATLIETTFTFEIKGGAVDKTSVEAVTNGDKITLEDGTVVITDDISHIVISKADMSDGKAIDAKNPAKFELTFVEPATGVTRTLKDASITDENGVKATISEDGKTATYTANKEDLYGLPDGKYSLKEITSPDGYTLVETTFTFTVENGVVVKESVEVETNGDHIKLDDGTIVVLDDISTISINKNDAADNKTIPATNPATFELTITTEGKDLSKVTVTTDSGKPATLSTDQKTITFTGNADEFKGLPDGTYTLKETTSPDGYTVVETTFTFEIKDGKVVKESVEADTTGDIALDENGNIIVLDDISEITLKKADFTTKEVIEAANPATFTLTLDTPAEGVTRTLKDAKITSNSTETDAVKISDDGKTATIKGNIDTIKGLPDGKYTLVETTSPDGYKIVDTVFTFTVENGVVKPESTTTNGDHFVLDNGNIVILDNAKGSIKINKVDASDGKAIDAKNPATFELTITTEGKDLSKVTVTTDSGKPATLSTDQKTITFTGNADEFKGLPDGTYTLKETTSPDGYTVVETTFTFDVKDGVVVKESIETETNGDKIKLDDDTIIVADDISVININKVDASDGKAIDAKNPATFELTITTDGKDLSAVTVTTDSGKPATLSDDKKTVTFTGNADEFKGLPDGTYTLKETTSPDGYTVVETTFTFDVKDGVVVKESIETETNGDKIKLDDDTIIVADDISVININKVDASDGKAIDAKNPATFELTITTDGKDLSAVTVTTDSGKPATLSDDKKTVTFTGNADEFKGLPDGTYTLKETTSPDGYTVVETTFTFDVKDGVVVKESIETETNGDKIKLDDDTIIVADDISVININKVDASDGKAIDAKNPATFELTITTEGKDLSKVTVTTDSGKPATLSTNQKTITFTGNADEFKGLPDGTYTLKETTSPDGYTVVETTFTFDVKDGVVVKESIETETNGDKIKLDDDTIIVADDISVININKVDASDGKAIDAKNPATFELTITTEGKDLSKVTVTTDSGKPATLSTDQKTITFTGNADEFKGLPDGTYTLKETTSPDGYTVVETTFTFDVKDGVVVKESIETETNGDKIKLDDDTIIVADDISVININKVDASDGKAIDAKNPATFELTITTDGKDLSAVTVTTDSGKPATLSDDKKTVTFTGNADEFKGLPDGTYTLKETTAPDGYEIVETTFTFTIENGTVNKESIEVETNGDKITLDDNTVIVADDLKKTETTTTVTTTTESTTSTAPTTPSTASDTTTSTTESTTTVPTTATTTTTASTAETTTTTAPTTPSESTTTTATTTVTTTTATTADSTTTATTTAETTTTTSTTESTTTTDMTATTTSTTASSVSTPASTDSSTESATTTSTTESTTSASTTKETTTSSSTTEETTTTTSSTTKETTTTSSTTKETTTTSSTTKETTTTSSTTKETTTTSSTTKETTTTSSTTKETTTTSSTTKETTTTSSTTKETTTTSTTATTTTESTTSTSSTERTTSTTPSSDSNTRESETTTTTVTSDDNTRERETTTTTLQTNNSNNRDSDTTTTSTANSNDDSERDSDATTTSTAASTTAASSTPAGPVQTGDSRLPAGVIAVCILAGAAAFVLRKREEKE